MAAAAAVLCTRVFTPSLLRPCRRIRWLRVSALRFDSSNASNPSHDYLSPGLERYKDLQRYFRRRLRATYQRFSNTSHRSVVYGHEHLYFFEGNVIYRVGKRHSEPEQVFNLEQVSQEDEKAELQNQERKQRAEWTIQRIRLSPLDKHLAATIKSSDGEELRCVVVRLEKRNIPSLVPIIYTLDQVFSFEWATDEVLFYTTMESLRCSKVFRLDLTPSGSRMSCVYEETLPDVFVEVALSRDQQILSINCSSRTSSEVLLIDTATTHLEPFLVQPRQPDLLYHVEHWRGWLIILANTGAGREYQVVRAPLSEPGMVSWVSLFSPGQGTAVKDMDVVGDHCVLVAKTPGGELVLITVPLARPKEAHTLQLPNWACAIETQKPAVAEQRGGFQFRISSPVHPPVSYCLYPEDRLLSPATQDENHRNYSTTRLEARSQDGTLVPVTLLHAAPVEALRGSPLLVHVYGAYGRDLSMEFCPEKRLLLEQGWALAYCHVRGGGERGLSWQRQARAEGKSKGVEDLQACLQHMFSLGVSSPSLTALTACSAGAVPAGALCNRHPHMMRAVTLKAPFLDVLGTMQDPSLPLTLEDCEEWGDPVRNPEHKLSITSYCPLHNITPQV
ncbi:prolyl endopeptidase-like isoform X2 [Betta splendens]|uniref:Prolyl endopeptidase n=1 Tax=Betta splendens TaxID=158456 RepID=A0A6P7PCW1_BETSP|nr:prolyl endopeptidase-like isoform X2 [Betta splendens]XP_055358464.1 prolyl endopeptidase-like isoform X2 [Betta splendens]